MAVAAISSIACRHNIMVQYCCQIIGADDELEVENGLKLCTSELNFWGDVLMAAVSLTLQIMRPVHVTNSKVCFLPLLPMLSVQTGNRSKHEPMRPSVKASSSNIGGRLVAAAKEKRHKMQTKPRVDPGRMEEAKASISRLSSGPLARSYCLALSTTLLSATAFFCLLASGLSCSFLSVYLTNPNAVIDLNTTNIPPEDQWYYDELMSEDNNALSVGILCQGDLDWLAPNTSDNSMRLLSKVFLIVALALGGLLLIVTCGISTFLPASNLVWDGISYIAAGMFVCEMPIFFLLDSPPCNNYRGMFSCQLASGSYSLIVSMVCSLSLAILTQWKYTPDWKGEYEIWNLRRLNEEMNQQPGFIGGSKTPEENSNDYEDEEMAMANQQQFNQRQQQHHQDEDEPAEIGVEIRVEKVPSLQRPQ
eukprot:scaffold26085_cov110-Skeletonema_marinoi.AAC.1